MSADDCCACGPKDRYIVKQQGDLDALRARLAAVTAERDEARAEVARLRAAIDSIVTILDAPDGHATWAELWETRENAQELAEEARAGEVSASGSSLRERMELGELRRIRELARLLIATYDQDTAEHDAEEYAEEALRAALGEP